MATFLVARNPEAGTKLPVLLRVPVPGEPLVLKTREPWPRTARLYCHRADGWPASPELIEQVPVRSCEWRGRAIDLVLDRPRDNRSQFVFARLKGGREGIFWQTAKTTRQVRPGLRLPTRRASGHEALTILADTRERYRWKFSSQQAVVDDQPLDAGDYAVAVDGRIVAAVERKKVEDLAGRLVDGQLAFVMADLAALPRAAVVIEGRYGDLLALEHVDTGFMADRLAQVQVRYPSVPIVFAGSRRLAEEWAFRFLGAARAEFAED